MEHIPCVFDTTGYWDFAIKADRLSDNQRSAMSKMSDIITSAPEISNDGTLNYHHRQPITVLSWMLGEFNTVREEVPDEITIKDVRLYAHAYFAERKKREKEGSSYDGLAGI